MNDIYKNYILVDICDTLFNVNTTFGLIKFHFKKNRLYIKLFLLNSLILKFSPICIILLLIEKLFNKNIIKYAVLYLIKSESVSNFNN